MLVNCVGRYISKFFVWSILCSMMIVSTLAAANGTHEPVTGVTVSVSGATDNSMSNGEVTVTAKGSGGFLGLGASAKTTTITVTNNYTENDTGKSATISFNWTASSVNQLTIDGTVYSGTSGSFSKLLDAGGSFTVTIVTAKNSTTNTLVMKEFAVVAAADTSEVTFEYDSSLGSITVAGTAVSSGTTQDIALTGVTVNATAKSGATFLGWIDSETNKRLATTAEYALMPAADMTVRAVFVDSLSNAWFLYNAEYMTDSLTVASTQASENSVIIPMNDGTLPAGDYTIPSKVTLLIPFDSANTLYTTVPAGDAYSTPKVYRTLTMESGANITVNGAMSVSAKVSSTFGENGATTGAYGCVNMKDGSSISVGSSGSLYVYGFITGSGTVDAASNSTVYQCFYFKDWRGGSQTTNMKNRVFPLSQYYIQNIEVPFTLHVNTKLYGYCYAEVSMVGQAGTAVPMFGSTGLFNMTDGYITMSYDGSQDRTIYDVYGTMEMNSTTIRISFYSISSANYVFGYNHSTIFNVHSGSTVTINKDAALYPGAKVWIEEGATFELGSGVNFYVYDANNWGNYCYNNGPVSFAKATYVPGRAAGVDRTSTLQEDAQICVNGTFDANAGYLYTTCGTNVDSSDTVSDTTGGGANIFSTGAGTVKLNSGSASVTYQCIQGSSTTYDKVPITSAQLKNADGSYVQTESAVEGLTYTYDGTKWVSNAVAEWKYDVTDSAGTVSSKTNAYKLLSSAVGAYNGTGYIQMLANTEESGFTINQATILDLAGKTVTLTSPLTNPTNLSVIDSATNGFDADGGKIVCSAATSFPALTQYSVSDVSTKYYITVDLGSNTYAFPRVATALTGIQYVLNSAGDAIEYLIFENTFRGNSVAAGVLADMGFQLSVKTWFVQDDSTANKISPKDRATVYYGTSFTGTSGATTTVQSLLGFGGYTADTSKYDVEVPSLTTTITVGENGTSITPETPIPTTTGS